jgi:hypothetical protein
MSVRLWICVWFVALAEPAAACSVSVPWLPYVNLVELQGAQLEGLQWTRIYNILDYEGAQRVLVHAVRNGKRFPVAKWQDGQECSFDAQGVEQCQVNEPNQGISLESLFGDWKDASERREDLRRIDLPIVVELAGREYALTLSGRPVRNTRELQQIRAGKISNSICERLDAL